MTGDCYLLPDVATRPKIRFCLSEALSNTRLYTRFFSSERALRMNSEKGVDAAFLALRLNENIWTILDPPERFAITDRRRQSCARRALTNLPQWFDLLVMLKRMPQIPVSL